MHRLIASFVAVSLALWLTSCGGGGSLGGGTTLPPTITAVQASCSPTSVVEQGTATCTAAVSGTGSYSSSVTWAASAGTITSAGAFTAPASAESITVTATSTEDTTKSGTTTITVTAPVVAVTISPTSVSVPSAGTEQFTATVTGSNNTAVTWSTTAGTISTSGLLSLQGVAAGTDVTVTATSVADSTKSASATVAVTQRVITLAWEGTDPNGDLSPEAIPDGIPFGGVQLYPPSAVSSGVESGDIMTVSDFSGAEIGIFNAPSTIAQLAIAFNCAASNGCTGTGLKTAYDPHFIKVQIASADGTIQSNELWLPLITDQPTIAVSPDGITAYFAPGVPFPIEKYSLSNGTNEGTMLGTGNEAVAVDNQTGDVFATQDNGTQIQGSGSSNVLNNGYPLIGITAIGGYGYVTQPNLAQINKIDLSQMAIITSISGGTEAGNYPYTMDAATVNGADTIAVYSEEDTTIRLFDGNLNAITNLPLTGITKATAYPITANGSGGWPLKLFSSGAIAFLSGYDKSLVTATLDSTLTLHLAHQVTLTGNPIGIAKDETHQAVIVWYANVATGMTTMQSFDLATLTGTNIASASALPVGFLASDVVVSADGTKLYIGGIDFATGQPKFYILQNQ